MENFNERFEDEWKKAFDNIEEEPNSSLWQNLENKLAEKEILIYKQKYLYIRRIAAALLILIIPLTIFFVYENGLKNDDGIIDKRTSDVSINNKNAPINTEAAQNKLNNIGSSMYPDKINSLKDNALLNENLKEKKAEKEDNSTQHISQDLSVSNSHEKSTPINITKENTPSNINPTRNQKNTKSTEESIALYSGNSKENGQEIGTSEVINDKPNTSSKTNIENEVILKNESKQLTHSINANKTADSNPDAEEFSKENKTRIYSENMYNPNSSVDNDIIKNPIENTVNKNDNRLVTINYLNGKKPHLSNIQRPPLNFILEDKSVAEVVPKKDRIGRWFASLDFTPTYTNQNFEKPSQKNTTLQHASFNSPSLAMDAVNQLDVLIKPDFSFNSGLGIGFRFNKRLYIESGVKYTYNQSIVTTNLFYPDKNNSSQTLVFNKVLKDEPVKNPLSMETLLDARYSSYNQSANALGITQISTINIYTQYITVPLTLHYKVIDRRFNLSLGGGIATDVFLQYRSKEDKNNNVEKEKIKYYDNSIFRKVAFSFLLNAELEYEISHKYGFYLRPVYKGSLQSYTDPIKLENRPNSTGVSFGIRYNFK